MPVPVAGGMGRVDAVGVRAEGIRWEVRGGGAGGVGGREENTVRI